MLCETHVGLRRSHVRLHTGPALGYMEPMLGYTTLSLSLMLRYAELMSGYMRPLLSYTGCLLPHVEVHKALANHRNPREPFHPRVQTLSKHTYI